MKSGFWLDQQDRRTCMFRSKYCEIIVSPSLRSLVFHLFIYSFSYILRSLRNSRMKIGTWETLCSRWPTGDTARNASLTPRATTRYFRPDAFSSPAWTKGNVINVSLGMEIGVKTGCSPLGTRVKWEINTSVLFVRILTPRLDAIVVVFLLPFVLFVFPLCSVSKVWE